jgi:hypothetical protein
VLPAEALPYLHPWAELLIAGIITAIYRWKREKIRADRDQALAELALKDTKPSDRGKIIDSLAKTKQFGRISLPSRLGLGPPEVAAQDEAAPDEAA